MDIAVDVVVCFASLVWSFDLQELKRVRTTMPVTDHDVRSGTVARPLHS